MTTLLDLYEYAEDRGIDVDWFPMEQATSLSLPLPDGSCAIAINPWKMGTLAQETVCPECLDQFAVSHGHHSLFL